VDTNKAAIISTTHSTRIWLPTKPIQGAPRRRFVGKDPENERPPRKAARGRNPLANRVIVSRRQTFLLVYHPWPLSSFPERDGVAQELAGPVTAVLVHLHGYTALFVCIAWILFGHRNLEFFRRPSVRLTKQPSSIGQEPLDSVAIVESERSTHTRDGTWFYTASC